MTSATASPSLRSGRGFQWLCVGLLLVFVLVPGGWFPAHALFDAEAWRELWREQARLLLLARTTATMAAGVLAISLSLGVPAGLFLGRFRSPLHSVAVPLLIMAAMTPLILYVGGWQACFGPHGPWPVPRAARGGLAAMVVHGVAAIPWVAAVVAFAARLVDRRLEDRARLEWNSNQVLWRVTSRAVASAVAFAGLMAIVPILTDMSVTDIFVVRTFAEEIYTQFEAGQRSHGAVLVILPVCLAVVLGLSFSLERWLAAEGEPWRGSDPLPLDPSTRWLQVPLFALAVVFALPILGLIRQLGLESVRAPADAAAPTLEMRWSAGVAGNYLARECLEAGRVLSATLFYSAASAALAVAVALPLAWQWRWRGAWTRRIGIGMAAWLFVLPGPVLGLEIMELCNRSGPFGIVGWFYDSPWIVTYAHSIRALPFAFAILAGSLSMLEPSVFESALLSGTRPGRLLTRLLVPMMFPNLLLAFLISLAVSLAELPATKFLSPPGHDPLVLRIFHLLHNGTQNQQAALCLVLMFVFAVLAALIPWVHGRLTRRNICGRRADADDSATRGES